MRLFEDLRTVVRNQNQKWPFEEDGPENGRAAPPTADWRNQRGGQSQEMEGEQRRQGTAAVFSQRASSGAVDQRETAHTEND